MILEGIMTTVNADETPNVSPMGPRVDVAMTSLLLRPYQTSTTYKNLKRTGEGVFHVTDNVELLAHAAVGKLDPLPELRAATAVCGFILADACRWYALRVKSLDDSRERTEIVCDVIDRGVQREFFGFNRAKHAVVEAAIVATRVKLLPASEIAAQMQPLAVIVEKTAGDAERRAFAFLETFIRYALAETSAP
jgi:hypothetical protein